MNCEKCGKPGHEASACPDAKSDVERLIEAMRTMTSTTSAPPPTPSDPQPSAPAGPSESEVAAKFEELIAAGQHAEAYRYVSQNAIGPTMRAMLVPVLRSLADANFDRYRSRFGEKFSKREPLLRAKQREYKIPDEALADSKTFEDLWKLTYSSDPTYEKEETDARIAAARKQWEEEQARSMPPAGLAPAGRVPPSNPKVDELTKALPEGVPYEYLDRQLTRYGITEEAYLEQRRKDDDPRATESIGVGPFKKVTWRLIGPVDAHTGNKEKRK